MRKTLGAVLALGMATVFASSAFAQTSQWTGFHIGLNAGGGIGNTKTFSQFSFNGVPVADAPISPEYPHFTSSGFVGGGQVGWDTSIGSLVVGAEADLAGSTVNGSKTGRGIDQNGASFTETFKTQVNWLSTIRARAGYEIFPGWFPYVTGGFAVANVQGTMSTVGTLVSYNASTTKLVSGGVVGGGLDYAVSPNWDVGGEVLYTSLSSLSVNANQAPNLTGTSKQTTFSPQLTVFRLTLNYRFGVPSAPPAPTPAVAAPPAPPPAAVAPKKQMFIVFFEFDKSSLTPDGRKVVDAAAAAYKAGKSDVGLAGYTDLAGTQQYNLALSHRRADAVKAALVKDGVPGSAIGESWYGKQNPRVPTADGVREPQNRRVEITM